MRYLKIEERNKKLIRVLRDVDGSGFLPVKYHIFYFGREYERVLCSEGNCLICKEILYGRLDLEKYYTQKRGLCFVWDYQDKEVKLWIFPSKVLGIFLHLESRGREFYDWDDGGNLIVEKERITMRKDGRSFLNYNITFQKSEIFRELKEFNYSLRETYFLLLQKQDDLKLLGRIKKEKRKKEERREEQKQEEEVEENYNESNNNNNIGNENDEEFF